MLESSDEDQLSSLHAQILRDPGGKNIFAVTPVQEFLSLVVLASRGLRLIVEEKTKRPENDKISRKDLAEWVDHKVNTLLNRSDKLSGIHKIYNYTNDKGARERVQELYETLISVSPPVDKAVDASAKEEDGDQDVEAYDNAKRRDEETFPEKVVKSLMAGENPTKVFRQYRGMTQKALAEKARIRQAYISQIERGMRVGSPRTLRRVAEALGVDIDDLV